MASAVTNAKLPIGVFDSGMGGLTVLAALRQHLSTEDFIYFGDTARLPYGTKSPATVQRYAQQAAGALVARGIKALVVACNTATAAFRLLQHTVVVSVLACSRSVTATRVPMRCTATSRSCRGMHARALVVVASRCVVCW